MNAKRPRLFPRGAVLLCLLACLAASGGCVYVSGRGLFESRTRPLEESVLYGRGKDKILLVDVNGLISDQKRQGVFSLKTEPSLVASVKEQLDEASRDDRIKGLVLKIDSPGGTVTASDVLYHEIRKFREKRKVKVVALFMDTAASGAYYAAMAADRVIALPTSVTGSIGVVLLNVNLYGLMEKIGVSNQTIKSGPYKDLGSPLRPPEPGERQILQAVVDDLYHRFRLVVEQNRKGLDLTRHPELADGRVFTADQALEAGLVDQIGYFPDAVDWIRQEMGIAEAQVVVYKREGAHRPNIYAQGELGLASGTEINLIKLDLEGQLFGGGPVFMYLWQPGL
ncbi:MAG: signal peptide peptidase SppA [bacterium]